MSALCSTERCSVLSKDTVGPSTTSFKRHLHWHREHLLHHQRQRTSWSGTRMKVSTTCDAVPCASLSNGPCHKWSLRSRRHRAAPIPSTTMAVDRINSTRTGLHRATCLSLLLRLFVCCCWLLLLAVCCASFYCFVAVCCYLCCCFCSCFLLYCSVVSVFVWLF